MASSKSEYYELHKKHRTDLSGWIWIPFDCTGVHENRSVFYSEKQMSALCSYSKGQRSLQDSFSEECRVCKYFHGSPMPSC